LEEIAMAEKSGGSRKQESASGSDFDLGSILSSIEEHLVEAGLDVSLCGDSGVWSWPKNSKRVKVVCVAPGLRESVDELGKSPRDQVVMVRVDSETSEALDAWVETGAVKSRSEAAALFIREGLNVRADELERLRGAIRDVESARERLREQARQMFGDEAATDSGPGD
jgi:hypothetical protein